MVLWRGRAIEPKVFRDLVQACRAATRAVLGIAFLFVALGVASAQTDANRVALLIANGAYPDAGPGRTTAAKDATLLAEELRRDSFDLALEKDLGRDGMHEAVDAFLNKLKSGSTALLYFNGVGIQVGRQTYLIPVDADIRFESDVKRDGINIDGVVAEMARRGASVKIVIIDAARRNSYERHFRAYAAGLASVDAPEGTLVMYAAAPNKVGTDATGEVSLLMNELVKELRTPDTSAEDAIMHTRVGVSRASNGDQVPWFASSLVEPVYLGRTGDEAAPDGTRPPPRVPPVASAPAPQVTPAAPEPPKPAAKPPEPAKPEPPKPEPPKPEPPKPEPTKESAKTEPAKPEPPKADAPKPEPPKTEAAKPESPKSEPKPEPPRPEPPQPEPPKPEPPKPAASAPAAPVTAPEPPKPVAKAPVTATPAPAEPKSTMPAEPAKDVDTNPGSNFRDCAGCPEMTVVPAGSFLMGAGVTPFDRPIHKVTFDKPFAIARNEVTFAEWQQCLAAGGCTTKPDSQGFGEGEHPVINVSWNDAKEYVTWLSKKTGKTYRLPSEAEWEYAARAGTSTAFPWGPTVGSRMANCADCGGDGPPHTEAVRSFAPNAFGLYDTAGNAAEWVEDCWNASYRGAPKDGSPWLTGTCEQRVLRGGSFDGASAYAKSAARFRYDADVRYWANGFRVVREVP